MNATNLLAGAQTVKAAPSFDAVGPVCRQKGTYQLDEIQTLLALRKQ